MAEIPPWVPALKISDEDYLEWTRIFPTAEFLLSWAIETTRVNEMAYIKWATSYYKLPVVKADFFQKNKPPLEMWKKYIYGPWSPTVLPLYEYKETLFVGVLEPKNFSLAAGIKVQLVLSPSTLQSPWWHLYAQLRKEIVPPVAPTPPAPEPVAIQNIIVPPVAPPLEAITPPVAAPPPVVTPPVAAPPTPKPPMASTPPPPPPADSSGIYNTGVTGILAPPEVTQTQAAGVYVIEVEDRPATPLGLEDNEIVPDEQSEWKVEISSPSPLAYDEPVAPAPEAAPVKEDTNASFAKVSAKPLEGAPESVAHALELLKAAREAAKQKEIVATEPAPAVAAPAVAAPTMPPPPIAMKPLAPAPVAATPPPPPIDEPAPIPFTAVAEMVSQPVAPPSEVAPPELLLETEDLVLEVEAVDPVVEVASVAPAVNDLLRPEKKVNFNTDKPTKVTKLKTNSSRKDTSIGFDDFVAPDIADRISPDGIRFDLQELAPPEPKPLAVETDLLPDGLDGGVEHIDRRPKAITPEGLALATEEIPTVELGKLENLISEEREIELPEMDFEKQQTLMDDLITNVRNQSLAPTHQGSTPSVHQATPANPANPAANPAATAAAAVGPKPSVTGPAGQNVEEIVFTGVPEGSIKVVLEKLKPVFERGMVLLRQEGRLRPYQWDPSWPIDVTEKGDVELALQSLFKIVVESKHPFHGLARPSMPSDRFFKKWNKNQYPPCVTVLPLKAHDEVFGVLLAVATASKAPTIILTDWEKVAADLSAELTKQIDAAA